MTVNAGNATNRGSAMPNQTTSETYLDINVKLNHLENEIESSIIILLSGVCSVRPPQAFKLSGLASQLLMGKVS